MNAVDSHEATAEVRTWIQPSMRESIDVALRDLMPQARVQHAVRGEDLYVAFPYRSRAILVCSVPYPDCQPDGDERRSLPLIDLLSGWDGSLLLCSEPADEIRGGGARRDPCQPSRATTRRTVAWAAV